MSDRRLTLIRQSSFELILALRSVLLRSSTPLVILIIILIIGITTIRPVVPYLATAVASAMMVMVVTLDQVLAYQGETDEYQYDPLILSHICHKETEVGLQNVESCPNWGGSLPHRC